jgi:hypothetical protein
MSEIIFWSVVGIIGTILSLCLLVWVASRVGFEVDHSFSIRQGRNISKQTKKKPKPKKKG